MLLEWQKVSLQDCGSDAKKRGNVQCCLCGNTANNDQYNLLSAMSSLNSQYDVNSKTVSFGNRLKDLKPNTIQNRLQAFGLYACRPMV
ncbi:hypothetical protein TNCV_2045551 [Trichonephila clavipes]|uniref:Uncharacterized protein n=1 Tax=Trichonephila clavipes TaxID=2585209 RepID=A0A8X6SUZ4_TRICX|nr:hypothetical protein TNCV_2045551 [Trichonephila clavipes]